MSSSALDPRQPSRRSEQLLQTHSSSPMERQTVPRTNRRNHTLAPAHWLDRNRTMDIHTLSSTDPPHFGSQPPAATTIHQGRDGSGAVADHAAYSPRRLEGAHLVSVPEAKHESIASSSPYKLGHRQPPPDPCQISVAFRPT